MFAGMVRLLLECPFLPLYWMTWNCYSFAVILMTLSVCFHPLQIFRKEPFFYGHDNHDQLVKIAKVIVIWYCTLMIFCYSQSLPHKLWLISFHQFNYCFFITYQNLSKIIFCLVTVVCETLWLRNLCCSGTMLLVLHWLDFSLLTVQIAALL